MSRKEPINPREISSPSEEEWLFDKAVELFNEDDYEEAHLLCHQVIKLHGRKAADAALLLERIELRFQELMFERAVRLYYAERFAEARELFEVLASLRGE
jgi:hypothetical protein